MNELVTLAESLGLIEGVYFERYEKYKKLFCIMVEDGQFVEWNGGSGMKQKGGARKNAPRKTLTKEMLLNFDKNIIILGTDFTDAYKRHDIAVPLLQYRNGNRLEELEPNILFYSLRRAKHFGYAEYIPELIQIAITQILDGVDKPVEYLLNYIERIRHES